MVVSAVRTGARLILFLLLHPKLVIVPVKVLVIVDLLVKGDFLPVQYAVNALSGEDGERFPEPVIGLLPEQGHHHSDGFCLDGVENRLYRDVAGHIPQHRVPVLSVDLVAKHAVQNHVQIGAVQFHQVLQILPFQVSGIV